jgi:hypothetical protein
VLKVTTSEAGASYAIQAINGGLANTGYAGYFSNSATTAGYGVYATNASTGAGYGVYGSITGTNNTGYGVYALNNSASGWGIYAGGTSQNYFAGNVAIGSNNNPTTTLLVTAPGSSSDIDVAHFSADGDTSAGVNLTIDNRNTLNADRQAQFVLAANGTGRWYIGSDYDNSGSQTFYIYDRPSTAFRFFIDSTGQVGIGNTSPGVRLDVGLAGTTTGSLRLEGGTSGYVQIQPAGAAGSRAMTLPTTAGTNGYVLSTNGSGVTSWVAAVAIVDAVLAGQSREDDAERAQLGGGKLEGRNGIGHRGAGSCPTSRIAQAPTPSTPLAMLTPGSSPGAARGCAPRCGRPAAGSLTVALAGAARIASGRRGVRQI